MQKKTSASLTSDDATGPNELRPTKPSKQMNDFLESDYRKILANTGRLPRIERLEVYPIPESILVEKDVRIAMADGVTLSANVFRPRTDGKVPVILSLTVYDKDIEPSSYMPANSTLRQAMGTGSGDLRTSSEGAYEGPDPAFWVPKGYACVIVDARGSGRSGGDNIWFTTQLGDDYAAVIEWAADQSWSTGKVGTNGVSYLAISQYHAASKHPRGLAAMIAWEGLSDLYRDLAYHGGIPETGFFDWWTTIPRPATPGSFDAAETVFEGSPTFADFCKDLWEPLNPSEITVPLLECAAWSNQGLHSRGSFNFFHEAGSREKWLFTHGRSEWTVYSNDEESLNWQLAFFDCFLKQKKHAMDNFPRVRLEVRKSLTEYIVRREDTWPPRGTEFKPLYLDAIKGLLSSDPPLKSGSTSYVSTENEMAVFVLAIDEDTEFSGPASLKLWIRTDAGSDIDVFVGLRKFDVNGAEVHFMGRENDVSGIVSSGWLRTTQRKLDHARSRPERPFLAHDGELPVIPGAVYEVDIEILPSSTFFEAGSRLVLSIGGRDIFCNRLCQHRKLRNQGVHTILSGGTTLSRLLLPAVVGRAQAIDFNYWRATAHPQSGPT